MFSEILMGPIPAQNSKPKYPPPPTPTSSPLPFLQKPLHFSPQATKNQTPIFFPLPPLTFHPSLAHSAKRYVYCSSNQSLSQHFRIRILSDPTQGLWYYYYHQHRSLFLLKTVSLYIYFLIFHSNNLDFDGCSQLVWPFAILYAS